MCCPDLLYRTGFTGWLKIAEDEEIEAPLCSDTSLQIWHTIKWAVLQHTTRCVVVISNQLSDTSPQWAVGGGGGGPQWTTSFMASSTKGRRRFFCKSWKQFELSWIHCSYCSYWSQLCPITLTTGSVCLLCLKEADISLVSMCSVDRVLGAGLKGAGKTGDVFTCCVSWAVTSRYMCNEMNEMFLITF